MSFVESYYNLVDLANGRKESTVVDTWLFLHTVLDDSVKELKIFIALPEKAASYQLIPAIAERSPLLTKLTIDFWDSWENRVDESGGNTHMDYCRKFETVFRSLDRLSHLTDLCLIEMKGVETLILLSIIGEVCPELSSLNVDSCWENNSDELIVALIMGKFAPMFYSEDRPSWCEIGSIERIDVPAEFRTPICKSLRLLQINSWEESSSSVVAFALRNIPRLQMFTNLNNFCEGIEMLHRGQQGNDSFKGIPISLLLYYCNFNYSLFKL